MKRAKSIWQFSSDKNISRVSGTKNKQMKKYIVAFASLAMVACSKSHFDELSKDPNRPVTVSPSLLLTNIETSAFTAAGSNPGYMSHMLLNTDGAKDYQYFTFDRGSYGQYATLLKISQMTQEANSHKVPQYLPISQFFRCFYLYQLTMTFGDIPDSTSLQAATGVYAPKYDLQKSVFLDILNSLEAANNDLKKYADANTYPVLGDVIYSGNVTKWRKLINSFEIRVLLNLSLKANDVDLNVKQRFAAIISDPNNYPIFQSNDDNAQLTYYNLANNRYPMYQSTADQRTYMDVQLVNFLKTAQDPRLFSFAQVTPNAKTANKATTDFTAYAGADASLSFSDARPLVSQGNVSTINSRYFFDPINEPNVAFGYAELQFNIAEGIFRGWASGTVENYYKNGIQASMDFYAKYGNYKTSDYFTTTYATPAVQYNAANGLQQIMMQKYISFYMNSQYEAWYNLRRTGMPAVKLDGGGVQNGAKLPLRFMYPQSEINTNNSNLSGAISRQYPSGDNINGVMWILQP
ncbi:SusD/RagB family nutrient-binding outer membrane lipoprotein [Chitinophagaceae bacterium 26-R-25]|nr:SusD/RagB family nutrient-binding outer membrane lipoprotein [Chitinophagaceae bacterium 26-R-25]